MGLISTQGADHTHTLAGGAGAGGIRAGIRTGAIYMLIYINTTASKYIHLYIYIYIYVCLCIYIYIYVYTYTATDLNQDSYGL